MINGLSKADSAIVTNMSKCTLNKVLKIASKSEQTKIALIDHFMSKSISFKPDTIGYKLSQEYLRQLLFKGVEKYSSAIVNVVDTPDVQVDEGEQTDNLLFLFYEALGWNRDDYLNPKKVRTTEAVYKQLFERIKKQNPDSSSIGMFMVNAGPGVDEDIPSGKVVLLDGWIQSNQ